MIDGMTTGTIDVITAEMTALMSDGATIGMVATLMDQHPFPNCSTQHK